eukprot:SM000135S27023  [mRNA]  locus=s135:278898:283195:- [translate_table: standard]
MAQLDMACQGRSTEAASPCLSANWRLLRSAKTPQDIRKKASAAYMDWMTKGGAAAPPAAGLAPDHGAEPQAPEGFKTLWLELQRTQEELAAAKAKAMENQAKAAEAEAARQAALSQLEAARKDAEARTQSLQSLVADAESTKKAFEERVVAGQAETEAKMVALQAKLEATQGAGKSCHTNESLGCTVSCIEPPRAGNAACLTQGSSSRSACLTAANIPVLPLTCPPALHEEASASTEVKLKVLQEELQATKSSYNAALADTGLYSRPEKDCLSQGMMKNNHEENTSALQAELVGVKAQHEAVLADSAEKSSEWEAKVSRLKQDFESAQIQHATAIREAASLQAGTASRVTDLEEQLQSTRAATTEEYQGKRPEVLRAEAGASEDTRSQERDLELAKSTQMDKDIANLKLQLEDSERERASATRRAEVASEAAATAQATLQPLQEQVLSSSRAADEHIRERMQGLLLEVDLARQREAAACAEVERLRGFPGGSTAAGLLAKANPPGGLMPPSMNGNLGEDEKQMQVAEEAPRVGSSEATEAKAQRSGQGLKEFVSPSKVPGNPVQMKESQSGSHEVPDSGQHDPLALLEQVKLEAEMAKSREKEALAKLDEVQSAKAVIEADLQKWREEAIIRRLSAEALAQTLAIEAATNSNISEFHAAAARAAAQGEVQAVTAMKHMATEPVQSSDPHEKLRQPKCGGCTVM